MARMNALAALAGLALGSAAMAQNTGVLLTDGDAVFRFGSTTTTALFPSVATSSSRVSIDNRINGGATGTDHGFDMQWYVGVSGRAREFTMTGFTSRTVTGTNEVAYSFSNAFGISGLSAVVSARLTDNAFGPNTSSTMMSLTLTNNTASVISNLDIFYSIDNDIGASAGGDTFAPLALDNGHRVLVQSDLTASGGPFHSAVYGYNADASGAGGFSALNTQLTDTGPDFTTLADLNAAGNSTGADYAQMMQWRRSLQVGQSLTFRANVVASIGATAVIPAPGALAVLGMGGLLLGRRRR